MKNSLIYICGVWSYCRRIALISAFFALIGSASVGAAFDPSTCNQTFSGVVYYDSDQTFADTFTNPAGNPSLQFASFSSIEDNTDAYLLKAGNGQWQWTNPISKLVPSGSTVTAFSTSSPWHVKARPAARTLAPNYDFAFKYTVNYSYPPSTQILSHTECVYYAVAWCGDGVKDASEACDLGANNGKNGSSCSAACTTTTVTPTGKYPVIDPAYCVAPNLSLSNYIRSCTPASSAIACNAIILPPSCNGCTNGGDNSPICDKVGQICLDANKAYNPLTQKCELCVGTAAGCDRHMCVGQIDGTGPNNPPFCNQCAGGKVLQNGKCVSAIPPVVCDYLGNGNGRDITKVNKYPCYADANGNGCFYTFSDASGKPLQKYNCDITTGGINSGSGTGDSCSQMVCDLANANNSCTYSFANNILDPSKPYCDVPSLPGVNCKLQCKTNPDDSNTHILLKRLNLTTPGNEFSEGTLSGVSIQNKYINGKQCTQVLTAKFYQNGSLLHTHEQILPYSLFSGSINQCDIRKLDIDFVLLRRLFFIPDSTYAVVTTRCLETLCPPVKYINNVITPSLDVDAVPFVRNTTTGRMQAIVENPNNKQTVTLYCGECGTTGGANCSENPYTHICYTAGASMPNYNPVIGVPQTRPGACEASLCGNASLDAVEECDPSVPNTVGCNAQCKKSMCYTYPDGRQCMTQSDNTCRDAGGALCPPDCGSYSFGGTQFACKKYDGYSCTARVNGQYLTCPPDTNNCGVHPNNGKQCYRSVNNGCYTAQGENCSPVYSCPGTVGYTQQYDIGSADINTTQISPACIGKDTNGNPNSCACITSVPGGGRNSILANNRSTGSLTYSFTGSDNICVDTQACATFTAENTRVTILNQQGFPMDTIAPFNSDTYREALDIVGYSWEHTSYGHELTVNFRSRAPGEHTVLLRLDYNPGGLSAMSSQPSGTKSYFIGSEAGYLKFLRPFRGYVSYSHEGDNMIIGAMQGINIGIINETRQFGPGGNWDQGSNTPSSPILDTTNADASINSDALAIKTIDHGDTATSFDFDTNSVGSPVAILANRLLLVEPKSSTTAIPVGNTYSVALKNIALSYKYGADTVRYYLTDSLDSDTQLKTVDSDPLAYYDIYVSGDQRSDSKVVDFSQNTLRTTIRSNALRSIKGRNTNTVVGGIYYTKGADVKLSEIFARQDTAAIHTIIVQNANLIIDRDLTDKVVPIAIVVLRDNLGGDILIQSGVKALKNVYVYADGSLKSAKTDGGVYIDSVARSNELTHQLILQGMFYTRNTINGSLYASNGRYYLPGGELTNDRTEALKYDISYLRVGNNGHYDTANNPGGYLSPVVIYSLANIQSNVPAVFQSSK